MYVVGSSKDFWAPVILMSKSVSELYGKINNLPVLWIVMQKYACTLRIT